MIYTEADIRKIIPALSGKDKLFVEMLIDRAEVDILSLLKKSSIPTETVDEQQVIPKCVKVACSLLVGWYLEDEKKRDISSYRQGSLQVQYNDSGTIITERNDKLKRVLAPLMTVQIWS